MSTASSLPQQTERPEASTLEGAPTERTKRLTFAAGAMVSSLGGLVLLGWTGDIEWLRSGLPGLVAMNPVTAIGFLLGGLSLVWTRRAIAGKRGSRLAIACAVVIVAIGTNRLLADALGFPFQSDRLLFHKSLGANRIAPNTAFNFVVDGIALILLSLTASAAIAQCAALVTGMVGFLALVGYLYKVPLIGIPGHIPMALNTALGFLVLAGGILFARSEVGPMTIIVSARAGGRAARRVLPWLILLPIVLGWLRIQGEAAALFPAEFGVALMVLACVVVTTVVLVAAARSLNQADAAVQHLLRTDSLTELLNRRAIMDLLGHYTAHSLRYKVPLSIAMIDIDHFKRINDEHGHPAGDVVLKVIAGTIRGAVRAADMAGRYGGEEFIIVLPHTALAGAALVAERIREQVADSIIGLEPGNTLRVSCSIGVAELCDGALSQPREALEQADKALYAAKRSGRNRVHSAPPTVPSLISTG